MDDGAGVPRYDMECELLNRGLIVVVGVEVGKVCVGVGFPSKLWVEVFISFLQYQIVFVEGLWIKNGEESRRGVSLDWFLETCIK